MSARSEHFAQWLTANKDKASTPEYAKVKEAYIHERDIETKNIEAQKQYKRESAITQVPQKETTLGEKIAASPSVAASLLTGATTGAVGGLGGTLYGVGKSIAEGTYGTPEGARQVEEAQASGARGGTYMPQSQAGQELLKTVLEPTQNIAMALMLPEAQAIPQIMGAMKAQASTGLRPMQELAKTSAERIAQRKPQAPLDVAGVTAAEQAGIPVMTSDVVQPKTFMGKWAQSTAEKIPIVGTGGLREAQQVKRVEAVQNLINEAGVQEGVNYGELVTADVLKKRSSDISKYADMKKDVFNRMDEKGVVPTQNATTAIDEQIGKLNQLGTEDSQKIIAKLEEFKGAIQDKPISVIEELRKDIGESFKTPDMAGVKGRSEKVLSSIYGPLKQDMEMFIKDNGERRDVTKWKVADKQLAGMMGELKSTAIKNVLKKGDIAPETVNSIIFGKKPSDMKILYGNLTPEGKSNARMAIIQEAAKKSTIDDNLNPQRFATNMEKLQDQVGIFFNKDQKDQIDGLVKAINLTKRAQESAVMTPTGVQAVPYLAMFGLGTLGGAEGVAAGATIGAIARLYESAPVRNALIRLSKAKNVQAENAALENLNKIATQQTAQQKEF